MAMIYSKFFYHDTLYLRELVFFWCKEYWSPFVGIDIMNKYSLLHIRVLFLLSISFHLPRSSCQWARSGHCFICASFINRRWVFSSHFVRNWLDFICASFINLIRCSFILFRFDLKLFACGACRVFYILLCNPVL